jgi:DNA-binding NarL/FixJ family response regulator
MIAAARDARAALELEVGRFDAAAELALQATEGYTAAERMIDAARARALAGRASSKRHDERLATRLLKQAHAEFDAFGARGYRDQTEQELRSLGIRTSRRERRATEGEVHPDMFTPREREIADLVAQGLTNREIGEQLFVSPKTVEAHLTRIFAKAGLPSRAAVAATVERWRRGGVT